MSRGSSMNWPAGPGRSEHGPQARPTSCPTSSIASVWAGGRYGMGLGWFGRSLPGVSAHPTGCIQRHGSTVNREDVGVATLARDEFRVAGSSTSK